MSSSSSSSSHCDDSASTCEKEEEEDSCEYSANAANKVFSDQVTTHERNTPRRQRNRGVAVVPNSSNSNKRRKVDSSEVSESKQLACQLSSDDVSVAISALNALLKKSANHDTNFALGHHGELVVDGLVALFDSIVGFTGDCTHIAHDCDLTPSHSTWEEPRNDTWVEFCKTKFRPPSTLLPPFLLHDKEDDIDDDELNLKLLEAIIMILRNLSYVASNLRFLAHSLGVLRILTGCCYIHTAMRVEHNNETTNNTNSNSNAPCLNALHTLLNLAPFLDSTGRKLFVDLVLLDANIDAAESKNRVAKSDGGIDVTTLVGSNYGVATTLGLGGMQLAKKFDLRDDTFRKVPDHIVRELTHEHIRHVLDIFPAIHHLLFQNVGGGSGSNTSNRTVVVATLDLMRELLNCGTTTNNSSNGSVSTMSEHNRRVFLSIPDTILWYLIHLLWIPRLGPDSLEYMNPIAHVVTRVSTLKLWVGYDATIDFELRDKSLELLVKLTSLSLDLKRRIGKRISPNGIAPTEKKTGASLHTRLYDSLLPALSTRVGRGDVPQLVGALLANLGMVPENQLGIMYIERQIVELMGSDPQIANWFQWTFLTLPPQM